MSLGYHKRGNEKIIEKTLMKVAIDTKLNDIVGSPKVFYTAGVNGQISKYEIKE
jgi:hypothetical protein